MEQLGDVAWKLPFYWGKFCWKDKYQNKRQEFIYTRSKSELNIMNLEKSEFFKYTGRPRTVNVGIDYWPERVTGHKANLKLHS